MIGPKPQSKKEARPYCGRQVKKAFYPEGGGKKQYFFGKVIKCPVIEGEGVCFTIEYDDGDIEDIAWEELVSILVPEGNAQQPSASNRDNATATKRLRQTQLTAFMSVGSPHVGPAAKQAKGNGLTTPPSDEGPEPSQLGTAAQQPRMQRQGRARKRDAVDAEVAEGGHGEGDGPPGGLDLQQGQAQQGEAERPKKRRAQVPPVGGEEAEGPDGAQEAQEGAPEEEPDPVGFVVRKVGSAGHIARIHLENFMCHHHFELDIGTHVTLISGTNGSGKSAVMQALQVCLGATARGTGRGTSMSDFIRTGANGGKVQVTLWNTGVDAFMPETFGDHITVERVIKSVGACPINLLDCRLHKANLHGEKPRDVLDRLLDHFSLDASNPLTIVTQELARQFLSTSKDDAQKKYEIFMQGTLMDKTQHNIKAANADVSTMTQRWNETVAAYNETKKEQTELRSRVDKLKSADKQLLDRDMLERAIVWRAVQQVEEQLAEAREAAEQRGPGMVAMYDRLIAALGHSVQEQQEHKQGLDEDLQRHQAAMDNHGQHIKVLINSQREAKANMERAKRSKMAAQHALQQLQQNKQDLDEKLEKENSGHAAEARRLVEEHQQKVTAKQAAVQEAQEAVKAASSVFESARNTVRELARLEQAARNSINNAQQMVNDHRTTLHQLAAGQGNRLAMFHAVELNRLIEQNIRSFKQRPIGPIGALLTVMETKWLVAAEAGLNTVFRDYLVGCHEDALLMRDLMRRARYDRAAVVTVNFSAPVYDVPPSRRPANGFRSLLDVVLVQDEAARGPVVNYLIDKQRVESTAVAEDHNQGRSVIYADAAGPHITVAIDTTDGHYYRRNGELKWTERNNGRRGQCQLVADVSEYVASLERALEQYEAQLGAHREDLAAVAAKLREAKVEELRCDQAVKAAMTQRGRIDSELRRLMQSAPDMPEVDNEEETILLTQLADLQGEMAESQMQLQNATEALQLAEQANNEAVRQAYAAQAAYEAKMADGQRKRQQLSEVNREIATLVDMQNAAARNRQQELKWVEKLQKGVQEVEACLQQACEAAEGVCSQEEGAQALEEARQCAAELAAKQGARRQREDRAGGQRVAQEDYIRAYMDCMGLERLLQRVNQAILKVQKDVGTSDLQELEIKLADKEKLLEIRLAAYRRIDRLLRAFQTAYDNQVRLFEQRRNAVEELTVIKFRRYLRRRNHEGSLKWDHKERVLKLFVKPGGKLNKDAQWVEDLKQLSGGERSYTTVSFLLAIGCSTESPFRCMDEYDVYMDPINRRVATETLLEFALENSAYQYIFLTPQDIQTVEEARQEIIRKRGFELAPAFLKTVQLRPARANATVA